MEATDAALAAGSTLDRYELLCPLAEGGMATVWLARMQGKRGFEKLVAIKTIKAELVDDSRFEEMFLDEARIASGIAHPNVAQIIDLGEKSGVLYLVMEWVDGESVAKVRKLAAKARVAIPLGLSLRIIADACAGLHAAHELKGADGALLGVVHRDVSPQNILIGTAGAVKIIDFGIARAENRLGSRTRTGVVKGKVQYMAPEQARGDAHDRRIDVWALGVCTYELVTGRLPFDGDNPLEILNRITSENPAPIGGDVPRGVQGIIFKALARNPADRFPTAALMRRALESTLSQLALDSSTEDLAAFVDAHMPHRATERREIVSRALKAAEARAQGAVDAFTGTVEVSGTRGSATRIDRAAGTQGTPASPAPLVAARPLAPKVSARALVAEEPSSRAPLWIALAFAAVASGAFALWRTHSARESAGLVPAQAVEVAKSVTAEPKEIAAPAPPAPEAAPAAAEPPIAPETTPAASTAPSAVATPEASVDPGARAPRKPPLRHGWPSAASEATAQPRNADWLPKQSELPTIAPSSGGPDHE